MKLCFCATVRSVSAVLKNRDQSGLLGSTSVQRPVRKVLPAWSHVMMIVSAAQESWRCYSQRLADLLGCDVFSHYGGLCIGHKAMKSH